MNENRRGTRWEILQLLKHHPGLTVEEMAEAIRITAAAVRKHLVSLEAAELVDSDLERRAMGRPVRKYHLTESAGELFPKTYLQLALSLLDYLRRTSGPEAVEEFFRSRNTRISRDLMPRMDDKPIRERVCELARIMDEQGAMSEIRMQGGDVVLDKYNCTLGQVVRAFPEACDYELKLYEDLLGVPIRRVRHMGSGDECCSYVIPGGALTNVRG